MADIVLAGFDGLEARLEAALLRSPVSSLLNCEILRIRAGAWRSGEVTLNLRPPFAPNELAGFCLQHRLKLVIAPAEDIDDELEAALGDHQVALYPLHGGTNYLDEERGLETEPDSPKVLFTEVNSYEEGLEKSLGVGEPPYLIMSGHSHEDAVIRVAAYNDAVRHALLSAFSARPRESGPLYKIIVGRIFL